MAPGDASAPGALDAGDAHRGHQGQRAGRRPTRRHAVDLELPAPSTPGGAGKVRGPGEEGVRPRPSALARAELHQLAADAKRAERAALLARAAELRAGMRRELPGLAACLYVARVARVGRIVDPSRPWIRSHARGSLASWRALARFWGGPLAELRRVEARAAELATCDARCRDGHRCNAPGNGRGGRCRRHGGASTGPRTAEGKARAAAALAGRGGREGGAATPATPATPRPSIVDRFARVLAELEGLRPMPRRRRRSRWTPPAGYRPRG